MNGVYGYGNPSGTIKNFSCLRTLCYWAGSFGLAQAAIFIGLTITGIVSYNCAITIDDTFNYGSVIPTIFMSLYFKPMTCKPYPFPVYDDFIKVNTVLTPQDILIWDSVYLGIAVLWLLSSGLLFIYIKKDDRKTTSGIILTWAIITYIICGMDLALGIIFGIDYGAFKAEASKYNLSAVYSNAIDPQAAQLLAAMVASISMMLVSFKGFILWFINACFATYLLLRAVFLITDNDVMDTLFMPRRDSDDILTTHPPINAYQEEQKTTEIMSTVFTNEAFVPDSKATIETDTVEINQNLISRAARMSKDVSFQERRFRNLDNFQQYPPRSRPESVIPEQQNSPVATAAFPAPDYTPPMQRAAHNRNQRY